MWVTLWSHVDHDKWAQMCTQKYLYIQAHKKTLYIYQHTAIVQCVNIYQKIHLPDVDLGLPISNFSQSGIFSVLWEFHICIDYILIILQLFCRDRILPCVLEVMEFTMRPSWPTSCGNPAFTLWVLWWQTQAATVTPHLATWNGRKFPVSQTELSKFQTDYVLPFWLVAF